MSQLKTQLYIDTSDGITQEEAVYQLVDFFNFETIEITESIKVVQDVASVFSDYTKNFVVPASKNNNKIFSHYYSTNLINGFDARIKKRARIFINGVFFKQGYIRLTNAKIKDGYPYSYELNFFGALSGLQDVIGEDKLTELTYLERFKHTFDVNTVFDGLTEGLQYNGTDMEEYTGISRDVVYPLISARNGWTYDSSGLKSDDVFEEGKTEYIYNNDGGTANSNYGLTHSQLKPAIKLTHVIDAINDRYASINFKQDSFFYSAATKDLYLLLHNEQGEVTQEVGSFDAKNRYFIFRTSSGSSSFDLDNPTGTELAFPLTSYKRDLLFNQVFVNKYDVTLNVTSTIPASGDVEYTMTILDGTTVVANKKSNSITDSLTFRLESEDDKEWNDLMFQVTSEGGLIEFEVSATVSNISGEETTPTTTTATYSSNEPNFEFDFIINIFKQMPDMKIVDFLTGLFKMFNLVAYVDNSTGEIEVKPLSQFYEEGTDRDITSNVDTFNYDVDRLQLYGEIDFKFEEASTFGLIKHNEINQDDFGNLSTTDTDFGGTNSLIFDEEKYQIELPFEKIYYDRLPDENVATTASLKTTTICRGWLVDEEQKATLTKPILFYNIPTDVDTSDYKFGMRDVASFIDKYNRPSNSSANGDYTLNFNAEVDEFTLDIIDNSLFKLYYQAYISNTFNNESRKVNIEGRLPLSFLFEYSLGDRLLVNGTPFRINEITTNLNTGKSQLELLTSFSIDETIFPDTPPPSDVSGLTLDYVQAYAISIFWEENTESNLVGYNVYLDGTLIRTLGLTNSFIIYNVEASTNYDIQVTALNNVDKESALGNATVLNVTTSAPPTVAPNPPTLFAVISIDDDRFVLSWNDSTSFYPIDYYTVYLGGVSYGTTTNTQIEVTGLTANTKYEVTVSATNTLGTEGLQSAPTQILTLT